MYVLDFETNFIWEMGAVLISLATTTTIQIQVSQRRTRVAVFRFRQLNINSEGPPIIFRLNRTAMTHPPGPRSCWLCTQLIDSPVVHTAQRKFILSLSTGNIKTPEGRSPHSAALSFQNGKTSLDVCYCDCHSRLHGLHYFLHLQQLP